MHLPGRMAALRLTPFTPTRRFWSVSWARHEDRIVGLATASARRGWMLDWQVGWMLRRGQGPPRLRNAEQPVTSGCESRSLAQGPAVTPPGPIAAYPGRVPARKRPSRPGSGYATMAEPFKRLPLPESVAPRPLEGLIVEVVKRGDDQPRGVLRDL